RAPAPKSESHTALGVAAIPPSWLLTPIVATTRRLAASMRDTVPAEPFETHTSLPEEAIATGSAPTAIDGGARSGTTTATLLAALARPCRSRARAEMVWRPGPSFTLNVRVQAFARLPSTVQTSRTEPDLGTICTWTGES